MEDRIKRTARSYYNELKSDIIHKLAKKHIKSSRSQRKRPPGVSLSLKFDGHLPKHRLKSPTMKFPSFNQRIKIYSLDMPDLSEDSALLVSPNYLIPPPINTKHFSKPSNYLPNSLTIDLDSARRSPLASPSASSSSLIPPPIVIAPITPMASMSSPLTESMTSITPMAPATTMLPITPMATASQNTDMDFEEKTHDFKRRTIFEPLDDLEPLSDLYTDEFQPYATADADETKSLDDLSDLSGDESKKPIWEERPHIEAYQSNILINRSTRGISGASFESDDSDFDSSLPPLIDSEMPLLEVVSPRVDEEELLEDVILEDLPPLLPGTNE